MGHLDWKRVEDHPTVNMSDFIHSGAPRVFVWSKKIGHVVFGSVYHYPDGHINAKAEGYHGDWEISHYAPIPDGPEGF